jgi:hypothetical protein
MSLRHIIQFVLGATETAGSDRMQQRLPNMGSTPIHQRDPRTLVATVAITEFGDEFETSSTAADNDDMMKGAFRHVKAPKCGSSRRMRLDSIQRRIRKYEMFLPSHRKIL